MFKRKVKIINTEPEERTLELTLITTGFVSDVKVFCEKNRCNYKETLSFLLETIKDIEELTENVN